MNDAQKFVSRWVSLEPTPGLEETVESIRQFVGTEPIVSQHPDPTWSAGMNNQSTLYVFNCLDGSQLIVDSGRMGVATRGRVMIVRDAPALVGNKTKAIFDEQGQARITLSLTPSAIKAITTGAVIECTEITLDDDRRITVQANAAKV
jgi:hypothetical protein